MKLTKNTWHYKFYKLAFGKEPNHNFCDYFWSLLLALVLSPLLLTWWVITAIACIFTTKFSRHSYEYKFMEAQEVSIYLKAGLGFVLNLVGFIVCKEPKQLIFLGGLIASLLFIFTLIFLSVMIKESKFSKNISETIDIVEEGFLSFKNKYCPKIDWE